MARPVDPNKCAHPKGCTHRRTDHLAAIPGVKPAYCLKCKGSAKPDHEFVDPRQGALLV